MASFPGARLFNAVFPVSQDERAFEWLLNCINHTLEVQDGYAVLICDKGKDEAYTRLVRRMYVDNPIPSLVGAWLDTRESAKNNTLDRIVEDPFFKDAVQSYFVQLVDFSAYALLRRERPVASKTKYGLDTAFDSLAPILVRDTPDEDPDGIIRPQKQETPRRGLEQSLHPPL